VVVFLLGTLTYTVRTDLIIPRCVDNGQCRYLIQYGHGRSKRKWWTGLTIVVHSFPLALISILNRISTRIQINKVDHVENPWSILSPEHPTHLAFFPRSSNIGPGRRSMEREKGSRREFKSVFERHAKYNFLYNSILECWWPSRHWTATVAFVHGPKGSGKSRMLSAVREANRWPGPSQFTTLSLTSSYRKSLTIDCLELHKATSDSSLIGRLAQQTGYWPVFTFLNSMINLIDLASVGMIGQKSTHLHLVLSKLV